jgi:antitoxin VapB
MTKEVRSKTFKSGNSVALRLPKALGIKEGVEMKVREEQGRYVVEPVDAPKRKLDVSKFWGKAPWLHVPVREDFEERPSTIAKRKSAESDEA